MTKKFTVLTEIYTSLICEKIERLEKIPTQIEAIKDLTLHGNKLMPDGYTTVSLVDFIVKRGDVFYVTRYIPGHGINFQTVRDNGSSAVYFFTPFHKNEIAPEGFKWRSYRWCRFDGKHHIPVGKEAVRKWLKHSAEIKAGSKAAGANLDF